MKILYVTTISNTVNAFLISHIKMLIRQGHTVDIATNVVQKIDKELTDLGCKVFDINFQRNPLSIKNYRAYKEIDKVLRKNYNLLHTHTPVASMISRISAKKYRKKGLKVLYTAHGFHFHKNSPLKNWLVYYPIEKLMSKFTDVLITINKEDYKLSTQKFNLQKIYLINGVGINTERYKSIGIEKQLNKRKSLNIGAHDTILTYVAELNDNKNQVLLLKAMKEIITINENYKLLLIGNGSNKNKYLNYIEMNNLQNNVLLMGQRKDIVELLSITDVYVASSKREGLPVNIMEAMSVGLPIVATDNRGHRELVSNSFNGYLIENNDYRKLISKVMYITESSELKMKISKNNINDIKKYDTSRIVENLIMIYEEI